MLPWGVKCAERMGFARRMTLMVYPPNAPKTRMAAITLWAVSLLRCLQFLQRYKFKLFLSEMMNKRKCIKVKRDMCVSWMLGEVSTGNHFSNTCTFSVFVCIRFSVSFSYRRNKCIVTANLKIVTLTKIVSHFVRRINKVFPQVFLGGQTSKKK